MSTAGPPGGRASKITGPRPSLSVMPADRPRVFGFLLVPNFTTIGFASAIEPLRMANMVARKPLYRLLTIAATTEPVMASNGVRVVPDHAIADAPPLDALFVIGPNPITSSGDRPLLTWIKGLAHDGVPLGGVCTGSHLLARAGLLKGYRCTIHWEDMDRLVDQFPGIIVSNRLFEIDRDRYTCSGGTAPMDMMFQLIARDAGAEFAARVSELLVCDRIRDTREHQRIPLRQQLGTSQPKLSEIVALMEANLEEPLELDEIARHTGVSTRQVERLFHNYLHRTPSQYYLELRLTRARYLLLHGEAQVRDIALACGFVSPAHFSKCYSKFFGVPPSSERRQAGIGGAAAAG